MQEVSTVFIVDGDPSTRALLEVLVASSGFASESFGSAQDYLTCFDPLRPGCLLCDVDMPGMSGLDLQRQLNMVAIPPPTLIFVTASRDIPTAVAAMQQGAFDFLSKPVSHKELLDRVEVAVHRDLELRRHIAQTDQIRERRNRLTDREREVLAYMIKGSSNKALAHELGIAQRTVELHRSNVMSKMGAGSIAELVRMAVNLERSSLPAR